MPVLWRCPYYRGRVYMKFGFFWTNLTVHTNAWFNSTCYHSRVLAIFFSYLAVPSTQRQLHTTGTTHRSHAVHRFVLKIELKISIYVQRAKIDFVTRLPRLSHSLLRLRRSEGSTCGTSIKEFQRFSELY